MPEQVVTALLGVALVSLYALAWMAGLVYVSGDANRRGLPGWKRLLWLVLALLPMLGLTLYVLVYARADEARAAVPRPAIMPGAPVQPPRRVTQPRPSAAQLRRAVPGARPATMPVSPVRRDTIATAPVSALARNGVSPAQPAQPVQPPKLAVHVSVVEGPHAGQEYAVRDLPARIGRGPEAAIRLDSDLSVSRRHAELYQQAGVLRVRDLGSSHGISVNGYSIDDKSLAPGDKVRIGYSVLVIRGSQPA